MTYRRQHGSGVGAATALAPSTGLAVRATVPAFAPLISPKAAAQLSSLPQQAATTKAAAPPVPFNIIPSWCKDITAPDSTPQAPTADQVSVVAYPFVKFTDAQIQQMLGDIYGGGVGGVALVNATSSAMAKGIVAAAPSFVASGWMPDSTAPSIMTRGTLWLAFSWKTAPPTYQNLLKYAALVIATASGVDPTQGVGGSYTSNAAGGKLIGPALVPKTASGTGDSQLQNAALASSAGTLNFLIAFASIVALGGRGATVEALDVMPPVARDLISRAVTVHAAIAAAPQLAAMLVQVPQLATQLASATPDTCDAAKAQADQAIAALQAAQAAIAAGLAVARSVGEAAAIEAQPGGGAITTAIQTQILAAANAASQTGAAQLAVMHPYLQCQYFTSAQNMYQPSLDGVASSIAGATADASSLLANSDQLNGSMAQVAGALAQIDTAKQQSCLSWWQKNWHGLPVMYWMAGGGTLLVGGALLLKVSRRKRAAAAKAAAPKSTPNRNRRRTSRNRSRRRRSTR